MPSLAGSKFRIQKKKISEDNDGATIERTHRDIFRKELIREEQLSY